MQTLLAGRVFESPIATHTVKMWMDEDGFLVTIHVDLKIPPGCEVSLEEIPPPLDLETRCRDQADAEECFTYDCNLVVDAQATAAAEIMAVMDIKDFQITSYPVKLTETMQ